MGAYSADNYSDEGWRDIIEWMVLRKFNLDEVEIILRSKLMRYAAEPGEYGTNDLQSFLDYGGIPGNLNQYIIYLNLYDPDPTRKDRIKLI